MILDCPQSCGETGAVALLMPRAVCAVLMADLASRVAGPSLEQDMPIVTGVAGADGDREAACLYDSKIGAVDAVYIACSKHIDSSGK